MLSMHHAQRMREPRGPLSEQIHLESSALASASQVPLHLDAALGATCRAESN